MRSVILAPFLISFCVQLLPNSAQATADFSRTCSQAIHAAEVVNKLPRFLLHAVSLTETGRWRTEAQAAIAWPWTINAGGKGKFFPTKAKALAEIKRLQSKGVTNIDVGCMQINLKHHGHAFQGIEEAIEPINNVAYAATFLKKLRRQRGSWAHAVGHYHNNNWKGRGQTYWRRVKTFWTNEQLRDFRVRRAARIAKNLKMRMAERR
jgi:hypothetical protein